MLARAGTRGPKLTLTVPTITSPTIPSAAPKSPFPASGTFSSSPLPLSPSSLASPTARNTLLNSRSFSSSLHPSSPVVIAAAPAKKGSGGGILKKAGCACTRAETGKKISFSREARINVVSPLPADCHGTYVRAGGEGRWMRG
ncbi:hypothetical protein MMC10_005507 [Thelotrema lepadinum]|nr:hypothetical protein [Thelotrema lepadinum]